MGIFNNLRSKSRGRFFGHFLSIFWSFLSIFGPFYRFWGHFWGHLGGYPFNWGLGGVFSDWAGNGPFIKSEKISPAGKPLFLHCVLFVFFEKLRFLACFRGKYRQKMAKKSVFWGFLLTYWTFINFIEPYWVFIF